MQQEDLKRSLVTDIIIAPDPKLRLIAKNVDSEANVLDVIDTMNETMKASNGLGLAAPQIGVPLRIIVMDVDHLGAYDDEDETTVKHGKFEMINPVITKKSGQANWNEGCLSIPGFKETVQRSLIIEVSFFDKERKECQLRASGLLAACIQHEIDHLDGVLFIDHISNLKKDMIVKKLKKFRKKGVMIVKPSAGMTF